MAATVRIVFSGEFVPGHDPTDVKRRLLALLKTPQANHDRLFSGQRVVLRKGLSEADAPRYVAHLTQIGVRVSVEPEPVQAELPLPPLPAAAAPAPETPPAPDADPATPPWHWAASTIAIAPGSPDAPPANAAATLDLVPLAAPPHAAAESAGVEQVVCPQCGLEQEKRTLCRACGIDMPRFGAARIALQEEAIAAKKAAALAPVRGEREETYGEYIAPDGASILGLSFSGRIGRVAYFAGNLLMLALMILGMALLLPHSTPRAEAPGSPPLWVIATLTLLLAPAMIRLQVLRLHDRGHSGWLVLLGAVPVAGNLMQLYLIFWPGEPDTNEYGSAPRTAHLGVPLGACVTLAIAFAALVHSAKTLHTAPKHAPQEQVQAETVPDATAPRGFNRIVMYSLTTCQYCAEKRRELDAAGLPYTEYFIDTDAEHMRELRLKIAKARLPDRPYGTPILEVNGALLPDNPTMREIREYLR